MPNVIVYSTQTCPFCTMVEDFLKQNKVEFKHFDVGQDQDALK